MKHKTRSFLFVLAALVFAVPMAYSADFVGNPNASLEIPPGANSIAIDIETDTNLRGVGFGIVLENVSAVSASVTGVVVNTTQLNSRQTSTSYVFLAGQVGNVPADDLPAGLEAGAVSVDVDVQGVTGDQARLIICGVNPWPDNPIFVDDANFPGRRLISCDTTMLNVKAGAAVNIDCVCPTYGHTYTDGAVAVQVSAEINDGNFVSLDLVSTSKDGSPTAPTNAVDVTGLGLVDAPDATSLIMYWEPTAGEEGTWEFCFEATNDLGDADTQCVAVEILTPDPDHNRWQSAHIEYSAGAGTFPYTVNNDFTVDDNTQGVVLPFYLSACTDTLIDAQITDLDGGFSGAMSVFEQQSVQNPVYAYDGLVDSVLGGLIDFGGSDLAPGNYPAAYFLNLTLRKAEGVLAIDSTHLPPANELNYNQTSQPVVFPSYSPGCYSITIIRNIPPTVICPVSFVGPVIFGDPVSVPGFTCDDPDGGPGPNTFSVVSMEKDGSPAVPTNAPTFVGDEFQWQTSNADNNDVGVWTFCVICNDGSDNSTNECCFDVEVIAQVPVVCFGFGCVEDVLTGAEVCVPLAIENIDPCKELGGFDLLFTYDNSLLTFLGLDLTGSILEASDWEYLTYRIVSTNPAKIRIVAIADMNNSNQHPNNWCLDGLLANVCFRVTSDLNMGCQSAHIQFCWDDCGDNTASSRDGNTLYIITDPYGPTPWAGGDPNQGIAGGGIIMNSCAIEAQLATMEGGITGPADFPCANPDTTKPDPVECLYFVNGKVKIICPGDIDDRGDLNLNGLAYEISDAVLYSNYFISGPSVFTINPPGQIAASDVNADGTPLTVADLVYLIRVITGDAEPIINDLLGGGPKVASSVGAIDVSVVRQGANTSVQVGSEFDLGAGQFVFKYDGAQIQSIQATGRASDMNVLYEVKNGELKVLLVPHMNAEQGVAERSRVSAGQGEILSIVTNGSLELVTVDAATFDGGALESAVTAKVLPTSYALHQNYPNPFNPSTALSADMPTAGRYTLTIYNIAGQVVKTFKGQAEAGTLEIEWQGVDNRGAKVASGVYFYAFQAGDFSDVRKMVLMK